VLGLLFFEVPMRGRPDVEQAHAAIAPQAGCMDLAKQVGEGRQRCQVPEKCRKGGAEGVAAKPSLADS
jgi:hypothetical protein